MLLAGPEFRAWRERTARRGTGPPADPVRVDRAGQRLHVTLDDPARRNPLSRAVRDGRVDAFAIAAADPTVQEVHLRGAGPAFCSGGDLDEFATAPDVALAHLVRLQQSAAGSLHRIRNRAVVHLHGWCIGAGIEIPAFAGRVLAAPDTRVRLPELAMGLIPGAGGTVGIPRRIGRWRTAYLALTGDPVTAPVAQGWGLVDGVEGQAGRLW
jgi:enoyl-CoA hydratase/carnithine racemase